MTRSRLAFAMSFIVVIALSSGNNFRRGKLMPAELSGTDYSGISGDEQKADIDIFENAERVTGCPAEILRGIAGVESHFREDAVGDNGLSHGMFQLHSRWHNSRAEKYGGFDPFNPADAAIIAGYIVRENLKAFDGDMLLAVAAYKQGVSGVNKNGVIDSYADGVLNWRQDEEKLLSFSIFRGN